MFIPVGVPHDVRPTVPSRTFGPLQYNEPQPGNRGEMCHLKRIQETQIEQLVMGQGFRDLSLRRSIQCIQPVVYLRLLLRWEIWRELMSR